MAMPNFKNPNGPLRLLLLLILAGAPAGCRPPAGGAPSAGQAPQVTVAAAIEKEVVEWDEYTGRLDAKESVEIRARVSGYLDKVHFEEGKMVKAGDLLFTIDKRPYQADFDALVADKDQSQTKADLAQADAERARKLIETHAISQEDFDTRVKTAAQARSAVQGAEARVVSARLNLEFTEVRSPISGRVGRALVTPGNLIVGGTAGTTLLTTVVSQDPIYAYVAVDERASLKYRRLAAMGQRASAITSRIPCELALGDEQGFPHPGEIDFVENRINASSGTVTARGVFANSGELMSPGMFVRLRVPGSGRYKAVLIPGRALAADQALRFVYVVGADSIAQMRPVKLGAEIDGLRVVTEGLKAGEVVITEGIINVRPGAPVKPAPPAASNISKASP